MIDSLAKALPPQWELTDHACDGAAYMRQDGMCVIISAAREQDNKYWLHVSCSYKNRLPSWGELKEVKSLFIGKEKTAIQMLPPDSKYVNIHPYCLHLWHCLDGSTLPDFSRGGKSI